MAGWFDHERDFTAEPHAPIRTPDYDDLSNRTLPQLRELHRARLVRLWLSGASLVLGGLIASLPFGWVLVIPATFFFVAGLFALPISIYLLRSVHREVAGRELQESFDRSEDAAS